MQRMCHGSPWVEATLAHSPRGLQVLIRALCGLITRVVLLCRPCRTTGATSFLCRRECQRSVLHSELPPDHIDRLADGVTELQQGCFKGHRLHGRRCVVSCFHLHHDQRTHHLISLHERNCRRTACPEGKVQDGGCGAQRRFHGSSGEWALVVAR